MVLTDTGAKLSKSLIRDGKVPPPPGTRDWMLDITTWPGDTDSFVDTSRPEITSGSSAAATTPSPGSRE